MSFVSTLLARGPSTPLSRYTGWNGALYLATGLLLYAWPGAAQALFFAPPFAGSEAGILRMLGVALAVIGWFYVMGARTGADSFGLATVVDRLLVPFLFVPLALTGAVAPQLALPFAVLDPVLAVGAFFIWRRQARASPSPR